MDSQRLPAHILGGVLLSAAAILALVIHRHSSWCAIHDHFETAMLIVAVVPWPGLFLKSISVEGVGKVELQEISKRMDENQGGVASLDQRLDAALPRILNSPSADRPSSVDPTTELRSLGQQYVVTRLKLRPGDERTAEMSAIFGKMTAACASLEHFDVRQRLISDDPGDRLEAYAFLYVRPQAEYLEDLVRTVVGGVEDKPFGQYWGIRAIGRIIGIDSDKQTVISPSIKLQLKNFCGTVPRNTDRHFELCKIAGCLGFEC